MIPKFRAWDKHEKVMKNVEAIKFNKEMLDAIQLGWNDGWDSPVKKSFDEVYLMQSTGLEDKDGVEIYEGDIVRIFIEEEYQTINMLDIVVFENGSFTTQSFAYDFYNNGGDLLTVKGNIYEHPEILEAQND